MRLVRGGLSLRAVARRCRVSLRTVQRWVRRAADQRLDRVDLANRPTTPVRTRRVQRAVEDAVLDARQFLRLHSDLGEFGADAIHRHLLELGQTFVPSVRTIGRILTRHGVLDSRRRLRRPAPPAGWYLADLAGRHVEPDSFDCVEAIPLLEGRDAHSLNVVSLHGHLVAAWPDHAVSTDLVLAALEQHWRDHGLPAYAQFDNDTRFQGPHNTPDAVGRVIRMCLALGVVPVFAPPRESGFQAAIESFNNQWQAKVVRRFQPATLAELQERSARYIAAARRRHALRTESGPARRPFPRRWHMDFQAPPSGRMVFLRRTNDQGAIQLLGHSFLADPHWVRRLVRVDFLIDDALIRIHALRRSQPDAQPTLNEHQHRLPRRSFRERSSRRLD